MLIYSHQGGVVDGLVGSYRNPEYFELVSPTDKVMLVGDYPHIEQAYKDAGIAVEHYQASEQPGEKPKRTRKTAE